MDSFGRLPDDVLKYICYLQSQTVEPRFDFIDDTLILTMHHAVMKFKTEGISSISELKEYIRECRFFLKYTVSFVYYNGFNEYKNRYMNVRFTVENDKLLVVSPSYATDGLELSITVLPSLRLALEKYLCYLQSQLKQ